jgi:four helix bundle protein
MIQSYRDLQVWQDARQLVVAIYRFTAPFPVVERYGLAAQLRRAAVSVSSNIAEGNGSGYRAAYARYVAAAHGSLMEAETQIIIAGDLGYVSAADVSALLERSAHVARLLRALLAALRQEA